MLKETKTFQQDCLHANLHQTVAKYFATKAKHADKVVCSDSHVLNTVVANPTLPEASEGQTDIENKEVGANSEHKQPVTADKVTTFNDILCPAQIITQLLQCPAQLKVNQLSILQKTDLVLNRIIENIDKFPSFYVVKDILYRQTSCQLGNIGCRHYTS